MESIIESTTIEILLATYNGRRFLEAQIESILNQSYPHIKLIIRDDCSTDGTLTLLQNLMDKYPGKIVLLPSDKRLGINGNFAELLNHAKAPYIMFSDQDDIWLPNKVEITLEKMKALEAQHGSKIPLLVFTDLKVVDENLNTIAPSFWMHTKLKPQLCQLNYLLVMNVITGCTTMFNQPLLQVTLPIPLKAHIHDWWLALVCAATGKLDYIETPTILYRQHSSNIIGAFKTTILRQIGWIVRSRIYEMFYKDYQFVQAHHLLDRFRTQMTPEKIILLENYIKIPKLSWWRKRIIISKYNFYTHLGLLNPFVIFNPFEPLKKLINPIFTKLKKT